jgi:hypothetical protein
VQPAITLGGHRAPWAFHGSAALASWLGARPWIEGGGLAFVRCGGPNAADFLAEALRGATHGADAGASELRLMPLETGRAPFGFSTCLADTLGLPAPERLRTFAEKVGEALEGRTRLFIGRLDTAPSVNFISEAAELKDLLTKLPSQPALTMIVIYQGEGLLHSALTFDFTSGRPIESVLAPLETIGAGQWSAYLHHRLAWECAGNLELALAWAGELAIDSLSQRAGDDEALEAALGQASDSRFTTLDEPVRQAWLDFATESKPMPPTEMGGRWQPQPGDTPRPQPWLARSLLRAGALGASRWQLRDCLSCHPLATAILIRCLELEASLRTRHSPTLLRRGHTLTERTREAHQQFLEGRNSTLIYPQNHPAPPNHPDDVWLFASLGEVVTALSGILVSATARSYRDLVGLRNGLAHGHHPGWAQLEAIRKFDAMFIQR